MDTMIHSSEKDGEGLGTLMWDGHKAYKATYVQIFDLGVALTGHLSYMYICEGKAEQQKMGKTREWST